MWPLSKANTILNVCPQGERYVVERFGKLLDIKESGWFLGACLINNAALPCESGLLNRVGHARPMNRVESSPMESHRPFNTTPPNPTPAIPYVDRIAYRIDMRERAMAIAPQPAITKDNVSVDVSGILYIQFVDPAQAAYGSFSAFFCSFV